AQLGAELPKGGVTGAGGVRAAASDAGGHAEAAPACRAAAAMCRAGLVSLAAGPRWCAARQGFRTGLAAPVHGPELAERAFRPDFVGDVDRTFLSAKGLVEQALIG